MDISRSILQFDNDFRDVLDFQFDRALPIDHEGIIGATQDLLGFVVEGILPHLIDRIVTGHAFFRTDVSGFSHGQEWDEDYGAKKK
jgi:hypothetical protein